MKLIELRLLRFGHFTDRRLDFSGAGLQIVYGANEAGKSTTLRAIRDLLFGIPERTDDDFLHGYKKLRLAALLEHNGRRLAIQRVKGRVNTLRDGDDQPLPEAVLGAVLGKVSRELFSTLFGLDHAALTAGGQGLLLNRGELGDSLFSAGFGGGVHRARQALLQDARELYLPQGKKQRLNLAVRRYKDARERVNAAALKPQTWREQRQALDDTRSAIDELQGQLDRRGAELNRQRRLQAVRPLLKRRAELSAERAELGAVVRLADDFNERWLQLRERRRYLHDRRDKLQGERARRGRERDELAPPQALLDAAVPLAGLAELLPVYRRAAADRPVGEAALAAAAEALQDLLRRLGRPADTDPAAAAALVPDAAVQAKLRELIRSGGKVAADLDGLRRRLAETERDRLRQAEQLAVLARPVDTEPLASALAAALEAGDVEQRLSDCRAERAELERRAGSALQALGLWRGKPAEFARLALPLRASVERCRQRQDELAREQRRLVQHQDEMRRVLAEGRAQLEQLERTGPVPSETALQQARAERDRCWAELNDGPAGDDFALRAGRFRLALERADLLADALFNDAERAARHAQLLRQLAEREQTLAAAAAEAQTLAEGRAEAVAQWRTLWRGCGIEPLTPEEMLEWLQRAEQLTALHQQDTRLAAQERQHGEVLTAVSAALRTALEQAGARTSGAALGELRRQAQRLLEDAREQRNRRQALSQDLAALDRRHAELLAEYKRLRAGRDAWRRRWRQAITPLGLPADAGAAEAEALLDQLGGLSGQLKQTRALEAQLGQLRAIELEFTERLRQLCTDCAPELGPVQPPAAVAELLLERAKTATEQAQARAEHDRRLAEIDAELSELAGAGAAADAALAALCGEAAVAEPAQLEAALARANLARELDQRLIELDDKIAVAGGGAGIEELQAGLANSDSAGGTDTDIDATAALIERLEAETAALRERLDALHVTSGQQQQQLDAMTGNDQAAVAAGDAQAALAEVKTYSEDYLRLRLAELLLGREIKRYQEQHQGPLLNRAGELFRAMTLQRYQGLTAELEDGELRLQALLADDRGRVGVAGLSEGTRDQLYLALRLASVERYAERGEPLPLVIDDILINFDDRRSLATLRLLAELAKHNQVLFFTHHEHLLGLARRAAPQATVHRLESTALEPA